MIILCQNCSARLQIDDAKTPLRPFTIRCPKCNNNVNFAGSSPASEKGALSVGGSPATGHPRFEQPKPAPLFEPAPAGVETTISGAQTEDLARLLAGFLSQSAPAGNRAQGHRPSWDHRQVLVCTIETRREAIARGLTASGYQVFVAQDTRQAVERMRENQLDVVLLDPDFDPVEQGAAFVTREVTILRPAQRRRLFFGLLSISFRTLDAHAAFLNNANVTINPNDFEDLPEVLDRSLREYNELYKDFNVALNLSAL